MDIYTFLKRDISNVDRHIDFFLSRGMDEEQHNFIIKKLKEYKGVTARPWLDHGFFSVADYYDWQTNYYNDNQIINLELTLRLLQDNLFLSKIKYLNHEVYSVNINLVAFFHQMNLVKNVVLGPSYSVQHFKNSIFKIEHWNSDDQPSIGTGFYFGVKNQSDRITSFILTNKHVVEKAKSLKVLDQSNTVMSYKDIIQSENEDLAAIVLPDFLSNVNPFNFNEQPDYLDEIFTMGFPSVPMTNDAYLLVHKGEVNSFVKDYQNNDYILISAKTSGGNSGGPIIDVTGRVIGMVTSEFFDEHEFSQKGKSPYYAGIPAANIRNFLNEVVIPKYAI